MAATSNSSDDALASELATRRRQLESELAGIEADAKSAAGGIGFGKRIGEGTNIAVERISEVAVHGGLSGELATVRRAEEKLAEATSGQCDECGAAIPAERLEAIPWAIHCVDCAATAPR